MKRIFCATLMCLVAFQTESMQIAQYRPVAKKFAPSTDLIRGMILLNKGTLLEQRHYGNIKFADVSMKDFSICSRDDEGDDSVSKLIVMLFPSAGGSGLNATGTGSLEEIFKDDINFETETDEPDNHGKIIAGLFKIANEIRKAVAERYKEGMDIHQLKGEIGGIFDEIRKIDVEEVSNISKRLEEADAIFKSIQEETKSIKTVIKSLQNAKGDTPVSIDEEKVSALVEEFNKLSASSVCYSKGDINDLKAEFKSKGRKKGEGCTSSACIDFVDKFAQSSVGEKIEIAEITLKICKEIRSILNEIQSLVGGNGSIDENCKSVLQKIFSVCSEKVNSLPATASCISYINMGAKNIISGANNNYLNFSESYFDISPKNLNKIQSERLYKLAKVTAESVLFERIENEKVRVVSVKDKWKQPYFLGYTNDVICAYVWGAYHGNLEKLAKTIEDIAVKDSGNKYVTRSNAVNSSAESVVNYKTYEELNKEGSELTEAVYEDIKPNLSVVPFYANHRIITNGTTRWKDGSQFADCVETTMRQLIATIFSKVVKDNDGKIIDLEIADERIPSNSHGLKEFFEKRDSSGQRMHVRQLANGGSPDIRDEWAKVCGEISGIDYIEEDHNLRPDWKNMIKLFCLLMKKYPEILKERSATPEEQAAANLIDKVNKDGDIDGDIIDVLNTLLGIRTDVKLVAESNRGLSEVKIHPNATDSSEDFLKCNELIFKVNSGHAQLSSIDLGTNVELNVDFGNYSSNLDGLDCIRKLYENETDFVLGCQIDNAYWGRSGAVKLDNYPYPLLSFYQILKSCPEHCRHLLHSAVLDLFKYGNAQHCAKGVFRLSEDGAFWNGEQSRSFVEKCYLELLGKEKKNFSAKNFIPFFKNIALSTDNIEKLAKAVGVLYSLKPLNVSEEERKDLDRACQLGRQKLLQLLENASADEAESCFHGWTVTTYRPYKEVVVCFDSSMAELLKRCVNIVRTNKSFHENKVFLNRMMLVLKNAGLIETKEVKDLIQDIPQKLREKLDI